jgi:flavin-dependent dehydrogenase
LTAVSRPNNSVSDDYGEDKRHNSGGPQQRRLNQTPLNPIAFRGACALTRFDALIIGGGPAGATAALLLAKAGWTVAVVEKAQFPRRKVCGEYIAPTNHSLFKQFGILDDVLKHAGPEVRRVGLVSKSSPVIAKMPYSSSLAAGWGRGVRREILDTLLLNCARRAGAELRQPWSAVEVRRSKDIFVSQLESKATNEKEEIESRVVIAAHGSWGIGPLPTQLTRQTSKRSDLLAFKAYFENSRLPSDIMTMLVFPGGYAGTAGCDSELVSFSCCIRRDKLEDLRRHSMNEKAGEAAFRHIVKSCPWLSEVLPEARLNGEWLATGPIRPGIRQRCKEGIFLVGNAAGEAHPTIADGISMAIQSAWLLAQRLTKSHPHALTDSELRDVARDYNRAWLRAFRLRIRAAEVFAKLALSNETHGLLLPMVRAFPQLLTLGARLGGIVEPVKA